MAASPVFPRKQEALAILDEELARAGSPTQSAFTVEKQKQPGTQKLAWWHKDVPDDVSSDPQRNRAYLRAYVRITGGRALPAGGLRLRKDRVWLDRSVISRLERDGYLGFEAEGHFEPVFVLTDKGYKWIASGELTT